MGEAKMSTSSLELENRRLRQQITVLEARNQNLEEELTDTRNAMAGQRSHLNGLKREVDHQNYLLEEKLRRKENELERAHIELEEIKKRMEYLYDDNYELDEQINELQTSAAEMKDQYDTDIKKLIADQKKKEDELHAFYQTNLAVAGANFDKASKQLAEKKKIIISLIKKTKKSVSFDGNRVEMQKFITESLKETHDTINKLEESQKENLAKKDALEKEVSTIAKAIKLFGCDLKLFVQETNKFFENASGLMGLEWNESVTKDPLAAIPLTEGYIAMKALKTGLGKKVSLQATKVLAAIGVQQEKQSRILSSMEFWKNTMEDKEFNALVRVKELEALNEKERNEFDQMFNMFKEKGAMQRGQINRLRLRLGYQFDEDLRAPLIRSDSMEEVHHANYPSLSSIMSLPRDFAPTPAVPSTSVTSSVGNDAANGNQSPDLDNSQPVSEIPYAARYKFLLEIAERLLIQIERCGPKEEDEEWDEEYEEYGPQVEEKAGGDYVYYKLE